MEPTHLKDYLSLLKCSTPDLVLISKEGENILTRKLLICFFSPTVADLMRDCYECNGNRSIQDAISLPFGKDALRVFVDLVENSDESKDAMVDNEVARFLGVSAKKIPDYEHREVKTILDKNPVYVKGIKKVKKEDISYNFQLDDIKEHLPDISAHSVIDKSHSEGNQDLVDNVPKVKKYKKRSKSRRISNFMCNICETGFLKENILRKHLLLKHNMSVVCTICQVEFIFYGIWIKQSGAMVFIFNLDKVSLKKLFPTMNI